MVIGVPTLVLCLGLLLARTGRRRRREIRTILVLAVGLALVGAAVAIALADRPALATTPREAVNLGVVPGSGDAPSPAVAPPVDPASVSATQPLQPERIRIPVLAVDAPVVPVRLNPDGSLQLPRDPAVIGWWAEGAPPGAERGTAILAGHVNTAAAGPGAFATLSQLRPGDEVVLVGGGREIRFRTEALRSYPKTDLPAEEAFSQEVTGRLALVTCGGPFNPFSGHYRDNLIAYGVPA